MTASRNLNRALKEFTPQLIVYNAGTDILEGDPLGCLSVSGPVNPLSVVFES